MFALFLALALAPQAINPTDQGIKPADPAKLMQRAKAEQAAGDVDGAIRDFRAVVAVRPAWAEAHTDLGVALAHRGENKEAIEQFQEALALTKTKQRPNVMVDLGLAYYKSGDLKQAKKQFEDVLAVAPGSVQAATLLGECDLKLGDPAGALAVLGPRAAMASSDIDFAHVYGLALIRSGKLFDGALVMEHIAEAKGDSSVYQEAGTAFLDDGDLDLARRMLETARRLDPKLAGINTQVGMARERSGDLFAAEAAFREALKQQPDDFEANLELGTLLLNRAALNEAGPLLNRALAIKPDDPAAREEAGLLRNALGRDAGLVKKPK